MSEEAAGGRKRFIRGVPDYFYDFGFDESHEILFIIVFGKCHDRNPYLYAMAKKLAGKPITTRVYNDCGQAVDAYARLAFNESEMEVYRHVRQVSSQYTGEWRYNHKDKYGVFYPPYWLRMRMAVLIAEGELDAARAIADSDPLVKFGLEEAHSSKSDEELIYRIRTLNNIIPAYVKSGSDLPFDWWAQLNQ